LPETFPISRRKYLLKGTLLTWEDKMGFLDRVMDVIRWPVDQMRELSCRADANGQACSTLSALSESMGGTQVARLERLEELHFDFSKILSEAPAQPLTGCYIQRMEMPLRRLDTLRGLERRLEGLRHQPHEVRAGCYIQHVEVGCHERLESLTIRPQRPAPRTPARVQPAVRETQVGCYMELHQMRLPTPRR